MDGGSCRSAKILPMASSAGRSEVGSLKSPERASP
jgi:hypothetical protein